MAVDVAEAAPEDVQVLVTWRMPGIYEGVPGSCIRWKGKEYITLSHVDRRSAVMRSDLPVGETWEERFLNLYDDMADLQDCVADLRASLRGHGRFASDESPRTVTSTVNQVLQGVWDMAVGLLIVGDTVFQRIADLHVRIQRSFSARLEYVAYLSFTKYGETTKEVVDRHGIIRVRDRMDDLRFPVSQFERLKPYITRRYDQVFTDLNVHDEQAFPFDNDWELVKRTAIAVVSRTGQDVGEFEASALESWLHLRDVVDRLSRERVPTDVTAKALDGFAGKLDHGWVRRAVAACRASLAVYRATNLEIKDEAA
jgi:hypothetical protein